MTTQSDATHDSKTQSRIIRQQLQHLSDHLIERHPWLAHRDALGLTVLVGSAAGIIVCAQLFARGVIPAFCCVLLAAFFTSLLHELEHDLIHRLYFRTRPWLYHVAMFTVWVFRPSTVNPWVRRDWHLHHHRMSGNESDLEERGLTNGERWGVRRMLMTIDPLLALALRPRTIFEMLKAYSAAQKPVDTRARRRILLRNLGAYMPFGLGYSIAWHTCLIIHLVRWAAPTLGLTLPASPTVDTLLPILDFLAITVLMPNVLRTACLYFVSSNIHYYGDVEPRNIVQQAQVWNSPWLWPLHLFCFNFGSTHAIHHFAVQQPFYERQWIAPEAHRVLRAHGVRFNDFSSLARANRWTLTAVHQPTS
jgi:hypothetical protein